MNGFKTLIYEKNNSIAYVTLNRPQALNVYNIQIFMKFLVRLRKMMRSGSLSLRERERRPFVLVQI